MTSILIVDDDMDFRTAIARSLEPQGFQVKVAGSVDEALEILNKESIDVLLTDLRMGERDGIDLLEKTRQVASGTRPILMSAFATARDHQVATKLGAVKVLSKPFTPDELNSAIRQAIECETGFRGSIYGISLVDLLQMFHYAKRTNTIEVGGVNPGSIHLKEGEIIHAEQGKVVGEEAIENFLRRPAGSLRTAPLRQGVKQTVNRPLDHLLLDVLRKMDEESLGEGEDISLGEMESRDDGSSLRAGGGPDPSGAWNEEGLKGLSEGLQKLAPETSITLVRPGEGKVTASQGDWKDPGALVSALTGLAESTEKFIPGWSLFEGISETVGFFFARDPKSGSFLVISTTLVGRYATVRFRSQLARITPRLVKEEITK